ncbi:hypothetical protein T440DRAFT_451317 [Plenodomus tracheiphilus IPT5]|uniref:Uncharacterized protein n=1 Tax=Plenodomus tracheiphilus IPT5 TaxID=1408161 RepID=A0A6A7B722_9PLEO|nr:hypothetical protein T440DRAFT_451317 [Plenodomus tracheiphilus IPT5]
MSYPPNSVELAERAPQHGIVFASTLLSVKVLPTPKKVSTSPSVVGPQSGSANAKTATYCSESSCGKVVTIQPHGINPGDEVFIKVRCGDCQPPLMVPMHRATNCAT